MLTQPTKSDTRWHRPQRYYPPVAPSLLMMLAIAAGFLTTWWWLAAIPFIWLGSISTQASLNLAHGWLAWTAASAALILMCFHFPSGVAILTGTVTGYISGLLEKWENPRPVSTGRNESPDAKDPVP